MSSTTITTDSAEVSDEIIHDKFALETKHKVMDKMKLNALLGSIAESSKFMAGPLVGIGLGGVMASAAFAVPVLIAAAVFLTVGVVAGYASARIWQSGQFDNFELNAQSTARHLVQELKTSRMMISNEHGQNARSDGKKWVQVVSRDPQGLTPQT